MTEPRADAPFPRIVKGPMRLLLVPMALALLASPSPSRAEAPKAAAPASSPDEGTLYTLGLRTARQLDQFDLSPAELETVKKGLTDGVAGKKPRFDPVAHEEKLQKFAEQRLARVTEHNKQTGQAFAAKAAKEKGAQKTATGLVFTSLKEGTGAAPTQADSVLANFEGRLIDGTVFDSSKKRGQAIQFPMAQAIPCLGEGAAKMKVGGKARLVCPASLAYGDAGR